MHSSSIYMKPYDITASEMLKRLNELMLEVFTGQCFQESSGILRNKYVTSFKNLKYLLPLVDKKIWMYPLNDEVSILYVSWYVIKSLVTIWQQPPGSSFSSADEQWHLLAGCTPPLTSPTPWPHLIFTAGPPCALLVPKSMACKGVTTHHRWHDDVFQFICLWEIICGVNT